MLERILELQELARPLEPDAEERDLMLRRVCAYAEGWLESLPHLPGYVPDDERGRLALAQAAIGEAPSSLPAVLEALAEGVDRLGVNEPAGHFFGFIPSGGLYTSALGDYLAAVTNRYAGVFYGAPGAVRLSRQVLDWLAEVVGYPAGCGGDLTSGGSTATLSALVTARDARDVLGSPVEESVVYLGEHTHHAVTKALRIAGLGRCTVRTVPLDARYRMSAADLGGLVEADVATGQRPWLVVASAGTTDTGAVDPMPAIADVCERHGMWFHVDAAYGGMFALCPEGRRILAGMERSDSIVIDPHKGLFVPFGTGVVLVKDRQAMRASHAFDAGYLQDTEDEEVSPADLSAELTRPFRGLRVWLPLKLAGVRAFRAALEEKLLLARYFHDRLRQCEGFEVGPHPDLSVVTFRVVPEVGDPDDANRRLAAAIQGDGRIYLSSTTIDGAVTLRLAVLGARTHLEHVDRAVAVIRELAAKVVASTTGP